MRTQDRQAEFTAYCRARWRDVVDSLVDAGVPPARARDLAAVAFADLQRDWGRSTEDPDARIWVRVCTAAGLPTEPGASAPRIGRSHVVDDADILTVPAPEEDPLPWIAAAAGRRRARGRAASGGAALALVLLAALGAWWLQRPVVPRVTPAVSPVPVPWYAADRLHLADVVVDLPEVDAFIGTRDGVAVRRSTGELQLVRPDGTVEPLERRPPGLGLPAEAGRSMGENATLVDRVLGSDREIVLLVRVNAEELGDGDYGRVSAAGGLVFVLCDPACRSVPVPEDVGDAQIRLR